MRHFDVEAIVASIKAAHANADLQGNEGSEFVMMQHRMIGLHVEFARWFFTEMNNGSEPADAIEALAAFASGVVANMVADDVEAAGHTLFMMKYAEFTSPDASTFTASVADIPSTAGGHA